MASGEVNMKLVIDKKNQRVLFAEAEKDCVDFLFHVLQLPIARVVNYLTKEAMVGSLGTLYDSLGKLNNNYIQTGLFKELLLTPKTSSGVSTPAPFSTIKEPRYYRCPKTYGVCTGYLSDNPPAKCPNCREAMTSVEGYVSTCGYVKGLVTYIIMDDLAVEPASTVGGIELLSKFDVKDVRFLEHRVVTLDTSQGLALLKASFSSKTVLTDVFLRLPDAEV